MKRQITPFVGPLGGTPRGKVVEKGESIRFYPSPIRLYVNTGIPPEHLFILPSEFMTKAQLEACAEHHPDFNPKELLPIEQAREHPFNGVIWEILDLPVEEN